MERSEMIEILKDVFRGYDTRDSIAERALSAVENAGMLPPCSDSSYCKGCGYNEWEDKKDENK